MEKTVIAAVAGIFIGALAVEILNRTKPGLARELEEKARNALDAFVTAFKEGWGKEDEATESMQPEQSPA
jgi:uncharacterized membrane-anchored protein YhcB (DUF1043 family)